jgi:hypothetical protein
MGQSELLERPVSHVGREVVQLFIELGRQGFLQLVVDLAVNLAEVVHGPGFGTDPSGLIQHFSCHSRYPEEALRVQGVSRSRDGVDRPLASFW